jgi:hypothetical protein
MRKLAGLGLVAAAVLAASPAFAFQVPQTNAAWPTQHQREALYADHQQPYTTTYTDEAARRLGLGDGGWEAFRSQPAGGATLKGGFDTHGAVLRLQW